MHDSGYLNLSDHDSFASGVPHETFTRMRKEDPFVSVKVPMILKPYSGGFK